MLSTQEINVNQTSFLIEELPDTIGGEIRFSVPLEYRRGSLRNDERKSIESGIENLKGIAERTGRKDWSNQKILDFGCGVKLTQTLIQYNINVQNYVGMDVHQGIIQFLDNQVNLPNFDFYPVPFYNQMYNRNGSKLEANSELPGTVKQFDLIILQSVFTHFAPEDFLALLSVLRRYVAKDARMLFTCFIDNDMEPDFFDSVPDKPLLRAYYKENFIREMLDKSGWKPLSLNPPSFRMQHHFVCEPALPELYS